MKTGKGSSKSNKTNPTAPANPAQSPAASATPGVVGGTMTTIDVQADVGFGNAVFLRGDGAGLSWDRGIRMVCVEGKTWRWSGMIKHPLTFKPVLNDRNWASGHDYRVSPGQHLEVKPAFQ